MGEQLTIRVGVTLSVFLLASAFVRGQVIRVIPRINEVVPRVDAVEINGVILMFRHQPDGDNLADDDFGAGPAQGRVTVLSGTFDELVFGTRSDAAQTHARLRVILQKKLSTIDRIIGLNALEREKLSLAGQGDIQRLLDRADRLRAQCNRAAKIADANHFRKWTEHLQNEAQALQCSFTEGPFGAASLLKKTMKSLLKSERLATFNRFEAMMPPNQARRPDPVRFDIVIEE
jgi:hypothetical protein